MGSKSITSLPASVYADYRVDRGKSAYNIHEYFALYTVGQRLSGFTRFFGNSGLLKICQNSKAIFYKSHF